VYSSSEEAGFTVLERAELETWRKRHRRASDRQLALWHCRMELQHAKERQAIGIALARQRGVYKGGQEGTTKATPKRVHELKTEGLTVPEIANALNVSQRTVFNYLTQNEGAHDESGTVRTVLDPT
jgi:DNA invertase Pin-like site-specific DNA recombinase